MSDHDSNGTGPADAHEPAEPEDGEAESGDASAALLVTERSTPEGLLVSVCDAAVLGESLATPDGEISIDVTEEFYGGDPRDRDGAADALSRAEVANLVGDRAVTLAVEVGLVDPANVLDLDGTPHAQFMRL